MQRFLIGCYTDLDAQGIHVAELNGDGAHIRISRSLSLPNPSYLAVSGNKVYAVNENHTTNDQVSVVHFDPDQLELQTLQTLHCGGSDPCYISLAGDARHAFSAHYSDGSWSVFGIDQNGLLTGPVQYFRYSEPGKSSHVHAAVPGPEGDTLLIADLGLDRVLVYSYDVLNDKMPVADQPLSSVSFQAGTGPRHIIFSPDARYAAVCGELNGSLHIFEWDGSSLRLCDMKMLQEPDFNGKNSAAEIHFSADGKFIYVSNRGDANQLIVFSFEDGKATLVQRISSGGRTPRNFAISPDGKYLLAAHQTTNDIILFSRDSKTGLLSPAWVKLEVPAPVFLKFI
ncbi:lactonase family protein [Pedobacter sp. SYP-B3415]|uniref:lactonase family protein n=1 Tax=Pedobacter sp. SYP-B3415 TaxID=2496641 RepID=UPI00101C2C41|nr:lactonase family protein [Pedobacter sp. SYP-B3415]